MTDSKQLIRFSAIFCDDVRREVGDKLSLMGVYNGSLIFNKFPAQMPILHAVLSLVFPIDIIPESLKLILTDDDDLEFTVEFTEEELTEQRERALTSGDSEAKNCKMTSIIKLPNVSFKSKTIFRTIATLNGDPILGDGLIVTSLEDVNKPA